MPRHQMLFDADLPPRTRTAVSLLVVAAVTLAVGISYWQVPYAKLTLPNALFGWGAIVAAAASILAGLARWCSQGRAVLIGGGAFPIVVIIRILHDWTADPTSHNLWPFEVFIATVFGAFVAVPGAVLGTYLSKRLLDSN